MLAKHAGCARFAYNWGLEQQIKRLQSQKRKKQFTNAIEQHRELVRLKKLNFLDV
ncbi:MAG: helix-turn-helix domain-containing protein [Candidatus Hermodarchaeota archaeon]|nr:helix-turn-helix domain-containing protein [Candidatus Hermodarchaeota archaeon]